MDLRPKRMMGSAWAPAWAPLLEPIGSLYNYIFIYISMYVCVYVCMYVCIKVASRSVRFGLFFAVGLRVWELLHSKGGGYLGVIYFMNV